MKKIISEKKGFTLIEIIGIIIILGVILVITIPNISNVISNSYLKAYEIDLNSIEKSAKEYLLQENIQTIPGIQTRIELTDMISAGLIDEIVDPETKETCDGYATITEYAGNYIIHPYLKCGSNYETDNYNKTDFVLPVINIIGDNPLNIQVGETYKEPGVIAIDDVDGNISDRIIVTGNINPNIPGAYTMTYNVTDNADNDAISVVRTINVVDSEAPIITFDTNGNSTYAKTRSTVVRVRDNSVLDNSSLKYHWVNGTAIPTESSFTTTFTNNGTLSNPSGATGDYYLWIIAKDVSGNQTITSTNVFKLDNTRPVITITGSSNITINKGTAYSDAGATATDAHSGLNGSVTSTGSVNPNVIGTYTITYNVSDNVGNAANAAIRTINVVDVTAPVITLNGSSSVTINAGSTYSDAGATALDDVDGNVTSRITTTGTVNPNVVGTYTITYTVKDNANNTASATRTIIVVDNTLPTVAYGTNGNSTYAKSHSSTVTVSDNIAVNTSSLKYQWTTSTTVPTEASFSTAFTNGGTLSSPAGVTGTYYLWILAKDTSGNTLIGRTNAFNLDNTAPSVPTSEVRYGNSTGTIRANSDTSWTAQTLWWGNFSATDATSGVSSYQFSNGCTGNSSGTLNSSYTYSNNNYTFCVRAIDTAGNVSAWSSATYIKADNTAPSVPTSEVRYGNSTGTIRANSDTSWSKQTLWWGNFSATDATSGVSSYQYSTGCTGTSSGALSGSYSYNNNNYTFCVRSIDNAGNISAWSSATYIKADNTIPVITMNGSTPVTINKGSTYSDAGATATDNLSGLNGSVTATGSVNPSVVGTYTITYNVSDNAGNAAASVTRTITVRDVLAPVITITGSNPLNMDAGTAYSDAGATATDDVDGNVTSRISKSSNVNPNLGGTYTVIYTVTDNGGNTATATRTVNVYVTWYKSRTVSSASYYGDYAATGNTTYSCPSGYTSSGSGSSMTCSKTTTANNIATTTYSCPSGYTSSGSGSSMTCSKIVAATGVAATSTTSCASGTYVASVSRCRIYTSDRVYSCPTGYTVSGTNCTKSTDATITGCASWNGWLNGVACSYSQSGCTAGSTITQTSGAGYQSEVRCCGTNLGTQYYRYCGTYSYSCSSGTLSGSKCVTTTTATVSCPSGWNMSSADNCYQNLADPVTTYSCSSGSLVGTTCYSCSSGTLSGTSCTQTASNIATTTYSCPSGYTSSGSGSSMTCSKTDTASNIPNTTYSCPFGGSLSGTTCLRGYYSCSSGTLSGSSCYGSWSSWTTTPATPSSTLEVTTEKRLSSV